MGGHSRAMDQGRQICVKLDKVIMQTIRFESINYNIALFDQEVF